MPFRIYYRNTDTNLLDHATGAKWVAAWQKWLLGDVCQHWPQAAAELYYLGDSQSEIPGASDGVMNFVKLASSPGSLGRHWLVGSQPMGEIALQTSRDDGVDPTSVGAHETGEMALDPFGSLCIQVGNLFQAYELCDRVEDSDSSYTVDGFLMENFSLPAAFIGGSGPWDFRGKCGSNIVLPAGYQLQLDIGANQWQQVTGDKARASKRVAGVNSRRGRRILMSGYDPAQLLVVPA
jgi:hypothetical protein